MITKYLKPALIIIVLVGIGLLAFRLKLSHKDHGTNPSTTKSSSPKVEPPTVISTKPSPLEGAIINGSDTIQITFNRSLVNDPARVIIEPKADYTVQLSPDQKTMNIIPKTPFELGDGYTITIKQGYGFNSGEKLDHDIIYHFQTIKYTGV